MRNKPRIRFKGFTEDWEQRKLLDIAKTFIGLVTTMTENYRDSGTLLIRNSDIKEGQFVFSENPIHLDEEFAKKNKTRRLQIGDVVTVHTGDIGTSAVIEEKEAGAIGFATINTRTDKSILNPYFLATYFNTEKHKCYANSVSTGDGRSNYNIKDFNKLVISVPTLDEQERISVLINDMNTIITLHQRKLEKLKLAKKALLQKLFPKNGSKFPELRFKGFADAWEQRKLCQITTRVTRKNGDQSDLPLTISAQDGLVDQRKYFNRQVASRDMSNYYLIKKGEFAYNKSYSEGYPFGAVKRLDYYDIGALSTLYILFEITDNNISSDFIVSYYMTHLWYKEISKRAAEGARNHGLLNISTEDFFDSELNIPNSIEEQVKIGNFIKQFDKFITLHQ